MPRSPKPKRSDNGLKDKGQSTLCVSLRAEAFDVLKAIMHNEKASAAARATAARTLLEYGANDMHSQEDAPIGEMSEDALDAEIARFMGKDS